MSRLNDLTILFLISHFLGDFQFQFENIADKKDKDIKYLITHILIHGVLLLFPFFIILSKDRISIAFIIYFVILISHFLIDLFKINLNKKLKNKEIILFILDQLIHISIIIILGEIIFNEVVSGEDDLISRDILNYSLLLILVTKPANILFKIGFKKYELKKDDKDISESGAGALIGNLERILSIIFLSINSIASIGFIYTAKSIARFKQIEENKRFAEYYLIGTLYSILFAIVSYYLIVVL